MIRRGAVEDQADRHYAGLLETFEKLGLDVAPKKCAPPAYIMLWIGVLFNTLLMTMAIDPESIREAIEKCHKFLAASHITLHQMQRFLGKLFHAVKCTASARILMSRLLDLLSRPTRYPVVNIDPEARADALWCAAFLEAFNGITLAKPEVADTVAFVDSCLVGAGGLCEGHGYYSVEYPPSI